MISDHCSDNLTKLKQILVDLTTLDPWTGSMVIPDWPNPGYSGLWMFTLTAGEVYLPPGSSGDVVLKVDGQIVAKSRVDRNGQGNSGVSAMSLNTIQALSSGQNVTVEWGGYNGAYIVGDETKGTHWTGAYLGSSTPTFPTCDYPGQSHEYPGSCRWYYICEEDVGTHWTFGLRSCCPGVYSPTAHACVADEGSLCPSEDNCIGDYP